MDEESWLEVIVNARQKYFDGEVTRIVDAGSRDGNDANWLAQKLIADDSCEIVCIEAREDAAKLIKKRYPKFLVIPTAISDFVGTSQFVNFNDKEFRGSSSLSLQTRYDARSAITAMQLYLHKRLWQGRA